MIRSKRLHGPAPEANRSMHAVLLPIDQRLVSGANMLASLTYQHDIPLSDTLHWPNMGTLAAFYAPSIPLGHYQPSPLGISFHA
jgi:hypothetical protein